MHVGVCVGGGGSGGSRVCCPHGSPGPSSFLAEPLGQWELCALSPTELMCVCWGHGATQPQRPASPCPGGPKPENQPRPLPPAPAGLSLMPPPENRHGAHTASGGAGHTEALPHLTPLACLTLPGCSRCEAWQVPPRSCPCPQAGPVPAHLNGEASLGGVLFPVLTSPGQHLGSHSVRGAYGSPGTSRESLRVPGQGSRTRLAPPLRRWPRRRAWQRGKALRADPAPTPAGLTAGASVEV